MRCRLREEPSLKNPIDEWIGRQSLTVQKAYSDARRDNRDELLDEFRAWAKLDIRSETPTVSGEEKHDEDAPQIPLQRDYSALSRIVPVTLIFYESLQPEMNILYLGSNAAGLVHLSFSPRYRNTVRVQSRLEWYYPKTHL